jgi:hypothetical protein
VDLLAIGLALAELASVESAIVQTLDARDSLVEYMAELLPPTARDDRAYRVELAAAIVSVTDDPWERRQLAKIPRFESNYRRDVGECRVLGKVGEMGAWQVLPRSHAERETLCVSLEGDARLALERVRESIRICARERDAFKLSLYARGSCTSDEGRRLSAVRWEKRR